MLTVCGNCHNVVRRACAETMISGVLIKFSRMESPFQNILPCLLGLSAVVLPPWRATFKWRVEGISPYC